MHPLLSTTQRCTCHMYQPQNAIAQDAMRCTKPHGMVFLHLHICSIAYMFAPAVQWLDELATIESASIVSMLHCAVFSAALHSSQDFDWPIAKSILFTAQGNRQSAS